MANRLGTRWRGKLPVPAHTHPLVRRFIGICNRSETTLTEVAQEAGLRRSTISDWRYARMPKIDTFDAALNALGYRLTIVKIGRDA